MSWLSGLFGKQKREKELEEGVRSHLEMAAREHGRVNQGAIRGRPSKRATPASGFPAAQLKVPPSRIPMNRPGKGYPIDK